MVLFCTHPFLMNALLVYHHDTPLVNTFLKKILKIFTFFSLFLATFGTLSRVFVFLFFCIEKNRIKRHKKTPQKVSFYLSLLAFAKSKAFIISSKSSFGCSISLRSKAPCCSCSAGFLIKLFS